MDGNYGLKISKVFMVLDFLMQKTLSPLLFQLSNESIPVYGLHYFLHKKKIELKNKDGYYKIYRKHYFFIENKSHIYDIFVRACVLYYFWYAYCLLLLYIRLLECILLLFIITRSLIFSLLPSLHSKLCHFLKYHFIYN